MIRITPATMTAVPRISVAVTAERLDRYIEGVAHFRAALTGPNQPASKYKIENQGTRSKWGHPVWSKVSQSHRRAYWRMSDVTD